MRCAYYRVPEFDRQFVKLTRKNKALKERFIDKIDQILADPDIGEPKSYRLKGKEFALFMSIRLLLHIWL